MKAKKLFKMCEQIYNTETIKVQFIYFLDVIGLENPEDEIIQVGVNVRSSSGKEGYQFFPVIDRSSILWPDHTRRYPIAKE